MPYEPRARFNRQQLEMIYVMSETECTLADIHQMIHDYAQRGLLDPLTPNQFVLQWFQTAELDLQELYGLMN